jgi:hypothetical protein
VGTDTAASLLVAVGDNPERLKSEASFALLCGVAPVPASSGKTVRHRLNRGGNRDANRALHVLALGRMSWDERTREYVARRTTEGKSKREILRCPTLFRFGALTDIGASVRGQATRLMCCLSGFLFTYVNHPRVYCPRDRFFHFTWFAAQLEGLPESTHDISTSMLKGFFDQENNFAA